MHITKHLAGLAIASILVIFQPTLSQAQDEALSPQEMLNQVEAPDGFDVTLFAAPPDISYPTVITAAPTGELFVGIDKNSSLDQERGRGEIVMAVDRDDDGRADRFTSFVDSVDSPRGMVYDGETLYVMHPPRLTAYRDTDGDGRADESQVLLRGLGFDLDFRGADHTTNGMQMGIDGWLYIAVGDYGFLNARDREGTQLKHRGGGIVRIRPDGTGLEIVAIGLRNVYDVAVDPYLNLFVRGNTNDGDGWDVRLNHIVTGADYGYPSRYQHFSDEVVPPLADYGGGSGTGALFVHDAGFPEQFGQTLYTADWGRNKIYRHPLEREGATFEAGQDVFLDIPRPTDMTIDGHSRLFASSWHGGQYRYGGEDVGYIVRLTYPDREPQAFVDVSDADGGQLVELLTAQSQVQRMHAQQELLRRGPDDDVVGALQDLASGNQPVYARVAAIFTLKQLLGEGAHATLLELTEDQAVRGFALRALADHRDQLENVPAAPFVAALEAEDPHLQLAGVTGLMRLQERQAAPDILPLTTHEDPVLSHVAAQALISLRAVQPALEALSSGSSEQALGALRVLQELHDRRVVTGLIDHLDDEQRPAVRRETLQALARLYHREGEWTGDWWGTRPETAGPYYQPITWSQSARIEPVLRDALVEASGEQLAGLLKDYERNRVLPPGSAALLTDAATASSALRERVIDGLIGDWRVGAEQAASLERAAARNAALRPAVVRFLAAQDEVHPQSAAFLQETARDESLSPEVRRQSLQVLQRVSGQRGTEAAVQAFARLSEEETLPNALQQAWNEFVQDRGHAEHVDYFVERARRGNAAERELSYAVLLHLANTDGLDDEPRQRIAQAIEAAEQRPATTASLLRAIGRTGAHAYADRVQAYETQDADPVVREAASFAAEQLELAGDSGGEVASRGGGPPVGEMPYEDVIEEVAVASGEAAVGQRLFQQQGCNACHTVSDDESLKGPFLGGIADRYSREELTESIMRPHAQIAQGFATHWFEMNDGGRHEGFVVREGSDEVEIRNTLGAVTVLDKDEIADRGKRENSMMPPGLVDRLTVQELASLVIYLESLSSD